MKEKVRNCHVLHYINFRAESKIFTLKDTLKGRKKFTEKPPLERANIFLG